MGESRQDIVEMAFSLKELSVESIPLNFLHAIDGTPMQQKEYLSARDCIRALAMFRFVNPASELRIAGGRERHLRSLQPLGLMIANSIFIGDYLTTQGQAPSEDYRMIEDLGFEITGQAALPNSSESACSESACSESTGTQTTCTQTQCQTPSSSDPTRSSCCG
jgi:biotin synthase